MVAAAFAGDMDTFPKYLLRNAERLGDRPAMRHKDFGIWQSWTWREQLEEVRKLALGLQALGLGKGDRIAVIGANRPRLYWTFAAAQSLGAVPVPVYADAVADEMAYVLDHAGVRFAVVQDQEQVDKIRSCAGKIPALTDVIYDEPRGLAVYPPAGLHAFSDIQAAGADRLAADPSLGRRLGKRDPRGKRRRHMRHSLHVRNDRPLERRDAEGGKRGQGGARHGRVRRPERARQCARLPAACLGRRPLSQLRARLRRRALHELSRKHRYGAAGFARDRAELLFRAAAHLRIAADQRHHPHGGRRLAEAEAVRAFHRRGEAARRGDPRRTAGAAVRPAVLRARRVFGLRPAEERARLLQHPRRLHGRRGDRAGSLLLLPLARHQPEAALRPDRSLPLCDLPEGWRGARRHGRTGRAQCRHPHL